MKYVFVVNPHSGKGRAKEIIPRVDEYFSGKDCDYEIYVTKFKYDAVGYVSDKADKCGDVRFYACGGDGTLFEVINGAVGHKNAEVGAIPLGSGNDFIKYFSEEGGFLDIASQVNGKSRPIDLIRCGDRYSTNICSVGIDVEVAGNVEKFKRLPFISGKTAYTLALVYCLANKVKNRLAIKIDGRERETCDYLLALAANSKWYGGGYKGAPLAKIDDGLLDIVLVKTISRLKISSLLKKYCRGEHIGLPECEFMRGSMMEIFSDKKISVNLDGEIFEQNTARFEIVNDAVNFIVPCSTVSIGNDGAERTVLAR